MNDDLTHIKDGKEELCRERVKLAMANKTPNWTMEQLDIALKDLKANKSRDPLGHANELFHPNVAGSDLKEAILKLMNKIKNDQELPQLFILCNVSACGKEKEAGMI